MNTESQPQETRAKKIHDNLINQKTTSENSSISSYPEGLIEFVDGFKKSLQNEYNDLLKDNKKNIFLSLYKDENIISIIEFIFLKVQDYCKYEGITLSNLSNTRYFTLSKVNENAVELKLEENLIFNIFYKVIRELNIKTNTFNSDTDVIFNKKHKHIIFKNIDINKILIPRNIRLPLNINVDNAIRKEIINQQNSNEIIEVYYKEEDKKLSEYLKDSFKSEETLESKLNNIDYVNPFNFEVDDIEYLRKFHELPVDTQNDIKMIMTSCKNILTEKYAIQNMINDEYDFFKSKEKNQSFHKNYMKSFEKEDKKELPDWSNIDKLFDNILNPSEPFIKEANELKALSKDISNVKEPTEFEISEGIKENKSMFSFDKEVNDIISEKINDDLLINTNKNKQDIQNLIQKFVEFISLKDLNQINQLAKKSNINISDLLKRDIEMIGYNSQYDFIVFEIIDNKINWNITQ